MDVGGIDFSAEEIWSRRTRDILCDGQGVYIISWASESEQVTLTPLVQALYIKLDTKHYRVMLWDMLQQAVML